MLGGLFLFENVIYFFLKIIYKKLFFSLVFDLWDFS